MAPENTKGRQPSKLIKIQLMPTQTKPSLAFSALGADLQIRCKMPVTASIMAIASKNACQAAISPQNTLISNAGIINSVSTKRVWDKNRPIIL